VKPCSVAGDGFDRGTHARTIVTTWTGEKLGDAILGQSFRAPFGDKRRPIWVTAINGRKYQGTYYESAGDYARVKQMKGKKMKILRFYCQRGYFDVNEAGMIKRLDMPEFKFSETWRFLGVSTHHWHNRVTVTLADIFDNPKLAIKGYVWDVDHGTMRQWGGGGDHRITQAWVRDEAAA
jgi:hypothetical protein